MSNPTVSRVGLILLAAAWIVTGAAVADAADLPPASWPGVGVVDNDACVAATSIGDGTVTGTTTGATPDGEDSCGGTGSPDAWYLYTATCDGLVHISTCGSAYDTITSIYDYPGCDPLVEQTCEDVSLPRVTCERIQLPVSMGEQKLIRISGFDGANGDFTLRTICRPSPVNDACEDATPVDVPSTTTGWNIGASNEGHQAYSKFCSMADQSVWAEQGQGVWYTVVGTGNRMTATTCAPESTLDAAITVYCAGCDGLICAGFNHDAPDPLDPDCDIPAVPGFNWAPRVSWCSREGQEYRILVFSSNRTDDFQLSVADTGEACWDAVDCTPVDVVNPTLTDNGDDDGWADTLETVSMGFTVFNRSDVDVSGLQARISTDDPNVTCIANPVMYVGDVAAGSSKRTPGAFTFRVANVDRNDSLADMVARFDVTLSADQFADRETPRCAFDGAACDDNDDCMNDDLCEERRCSISGEPCFYSRNCDAGQCEGTCSRTGRSCWDSELHREGFGSFMNCDGEDICVDESQEIRIQLDLDAAGGSGRTTFFESFEERGLSTFTAVNLDAELASPEAADGYRCQSHNLDAPNASGGDPATCHPALDQAHADDFHWQTDAGRAFSGVQSLYAGVEVEPGVYSAAHGVLEAVQTTQPINLDWGRRCARSGTACELDGDCSGGERCVGAVPELSVKQQVNLPDWFLTTAWIPFSLSRGVLQVQVVDDNGEPLSDWMRLEPYQNGYDSVDSTSFTACTFDPIDDGNTEDDFFDPSDPARRFGPSSTCYPNFTFSRIGDTLEPFNPQALGAATDGPGLAGSSGLGTWVESKFSLEPFRGRRVHLRLLHTGAKFGGLGPWWPAGWIYEGWWVDDVTVTNTLVSPASLQVDMKDNSALGVDADNDCFGDVSDCDPSDGQAWALPGEVIGLRLSHSGGLAGSTTLSWLGPSDPGGTAVDYSLIVTQAGACEETSVGSATTTTDTDTLAPGMLNQFLVRASNACGPGLLGSDSAYNPRPGCP